MNSKTIAYVAGRSGGHIIPALTLARAAKEASSDTTILFFSTSSALDKEIISQHSLLVDKHIALSLDPVPFLNPFKIARFAVQFALTFFKSISYLRAYKPVKLVGMGGYICLPVCWAAHLLHIPIELYDLDAIPGRATRALKYHAQTVFTCFEEAAAHLPAKKVVLTAYPLRFSPELLKVNPGTIRSQLKLSETKKIIFINGGSQGSLFINERIKEWLNFNEHVHALIQIIHQVGARDKTDWVSFYKELEIPAVVFGFQDDLTRYYQVADIILCRAGAGSLFEAKFFNIPCITIPLETAATSHQKYNAQAFCNRYPTQFTMITNDQLAHDNMVLFSALNKHIHTPAKASLNQSNQSQCL